MKKMIAVGIITVLTIGLSGCSWFQPAEPANETKIESTIEQPAIETETESTTEQPAYEAGTTYMVSRNLKPWVCSANGDPCDNITVTTEVDLTEPAPGNELTGKYFIRAYDGDYKTGTKIGELQLTQNYNPFGENTLDPDEILTLLTFQKQAQSIDSIFESKFYLQYKDPVPGWDMPGYILHLENEGEKSDYDGRFIDFLYKDGKMEISVPQ
jgi:hypothetical protein